MLQFFIFSFVFATSSQNVSFRYYVNDKYVDVAIVKVGDLRVNEICKKTSSCQALKTAKGKPFKTQESKAPTYGNPAANYCWDVGAKNRILKDSKNHEYDFCVFPDGSMIDAWNLHSKHYPPKPIK